MAKRPKTCIYVGDIQKKLKGCTGHARPADDEDPTAVAGLWAFQVGGEGDIVWVRAVDLKFI